MSNIDVTFGIPTKDRYEALGNCLISIALQTVKPKRVIIIDDSDNSQDIRNLPNTFYALKLLNFHNIEFYVEQGVKKGQHFSHQKIQETADTEWIFRIDDDCVLEPNVLEILWSNANSDDKIGAVAPLILLPDPQQLPEDISHNTIADIYSAPNIQWFLQSGYKEVEHLNSSFLYRKGIANYNLYLSKVAHREETIFSHEIKRAGYKLFVIPYARCWHFRQESGGIRSHKDPSLYEHDEEIFRKLMNEWYRKEKGDSKMIVLDNGLGDHFAFLHILPELLTKYPRITIAACYPDIFEEFKDRIKLISIAEAKLILGDISGYSIYTWMNDNNHQGNLVNAFRDFYQ